MYVLAMFSRVLLEQPDQKSITDRKGEMEANS